MLCCCETSELIAQAITEPPRLLITTDIGGDPDDTQSLIRLLLYLNEFDLEGIVVSASGTPGELQEAVVRPDLVHALIDQYAMVVPSLHQHDGRYPTPDVLHALVKKGNPQRGWNSVGHGHDTEGSNWLVQAMEKRESRPLNICVWGGQTDLAQALWQIKHTRTQVDYETITSNIKIYDIADQDQIFSKIWSSFPNLFYILNKADEAKDKREATFRGMYLGGDEDLTSLRWLEQHVQIHHGALGALYPSKTWTAPNPYGAMKEGDTPSWFYFLDNGLNMSDHPTLGGWGGRFDEAEDGLYRDAIDSVGGTMSARASVWRWRQDFQNDFEARMDWCLEGFENANHAPSLVVEGTKIGVFHATARSNLTIEIDLEGSSDPDHDDMTFEHVPYPELNDGGSIQVEFKGKLAILHVPSNLPRKTYQVVLAVRDHGIPSLTSYRRIQVSVD